jgi:hypothetical protein
VRKEINEFVKKIRDVVDSEDGNAAKLAAILTETAALAEDLVHRDGKDGLFHVDMEDVENLGKSLRIASYNANPQYCPLCEKLISKYDVLTTVISTSCGPMHRECMVAEAVASVQSTTKRRKAQAVEAEG